MKITLKDGSVFEGTAEEYVELVKLGEGIAEPKEEYIPKVGDKVRALADSEFRDVRKGEIGVVISVDAACGDSDEYSVAVETEEERCYFRPQDLELVTVVDEKEYPLVEGDYIVPLPTADERYLYTNSEMQLGKVEEKVGDSIRVRIVAHDRAGFVDAELFYVDSEHFRKATDEEVAKIEDKEEDKPKQGDIVVITGNTNNSRNKVGDIGKVGVVLLNNIARVNVPGRPSVNYTKFSEMRLANDEEKKQYEQAEKFAKLGRKPGEFKKGDIVRGHRYDDEMCKFTGEVEDVADGMIGVRDFDRKYHAANKGDCELIAPVESHVDFDD